MDIRTGKTTLPSGAAIAALLAAAWVHGVGKLWMSGAEGIGPYSGKETLSLLAWLGSWAVLNPALRVREMDLARWLVIFLVAVGIATTLIWPPVFEYLAGH